MCRTARWNNRLTLLAVTLTLAAGPTLAGVSSQGTPGGNLLNPTGADPARKGDKDPKGMSYWRDTPRHTPSGILYTVPDLGPTYTDMGNGWQRYLAVEAGGLFRDGGGEPDARFGEYFDYDDGVFINSLRLSLWNPQAGRYLDFSGGALGRADQYWAVQGGRYGDFRLTARYDGIPHQFTRDAHTLYQGVGSGKLTLPPGLTPGDNTESAIAAALAQSASELRLGLQRNTGRLDLDLTPSDRLTLFARYSHELRDGTRPFGGGFFFPLSLGPAGTIGGVSETVEPIDYTTHDFSAGLKFAERAYQVNLTYTGSLFRNDTDSLTFDNPFHLGSVLEPPPPIGAGVPAFPVPQGRYALSPDNSYHNLKLDFAHTLPLQGQLTSSASYSVMRQDDDLLPPTVNSGPGGTFIAPVNLDLWNTTAALPRDSADADIRNIQGQLGINLRPARRLRVGGELKYFEQDNRTRYTAYNPQTGQYGYIALDGGLGNSVPGEIGIWDPLAPANWHYRSIPFSYQRYNGDLFADYRLTAASTLEMRYGRERYARDDREYDDTDEDRWRLAYVNRGFARATLRLSYEYARRRGDGYEFNPYEDYYTSSLPGALAPIFPHTLAQLRKYDLAERDQQKFNGRLNFILREGMDLALSATTEDNDYDARYGLDGRRYRRANVEWNWQPRATANVFAFYGYERGKSKQANINDDPLTLGTSTDPNAGGIIYPLGNAWWEYNRETNHLAGLGLNWQINRRVAIESNYTFSYGRGETDTRMASAGALSTQEGPAPTDNAFPDLRDIEHWLETSVKFTVNEHTAVRLYHRYQAVNISDWHYLGLSNDEIVNRTVYIDDGPEDYAAHLIGVFVQYRF